ncbi:MAG: helix-hairpin-helix domain-containing protein [Candidatus Dormibacteria bacterium]
MSVIAIFQGANRKRTAFMIAGLILLLAGVLAGARSRQAPAKTVVPPAVDAPAPAAALVFVSGAVQHPGLYRLSPDARVADALAVSGGVTADADPGKLPNVAAKVHDGHQINVPFLRSGRGASASARSVVAKLDVNTATLEELRSVPAMPAGLPEAIIEYRTRYGHFQSLVDMRDTLGVDKALMRALNGSLTCLP